MGGGHDLQQALFARGGQRLHVLVQYRPERLGRFPFRMLGRHRLDAVEGERELEIERLFAPQRAVIVEGGDALLGGTKSAPPCVVTRETKSVIAFLTAPSFQEGKGRFGRAPRGLE